MDIRYDLAVAGMSRLSSHRTLRNANPVLLWALVSAHGALFIEVGMLTVKLNDAVSTHNGFALWALSGVSDAHIADTASVDFLIVTDLVRRRLGVLRTTISTGYFFVHCL